ncbi:MAG: PadR family transcriptional regulator [Chloroflexi bacterium]|nr:MAG: PadR family transcriptional regulator [Chloroflexota bacterium]
MTGLQQLRRGSTPMLILSVLADGRMYGYQIMRELERRSEGYFTMTAALLYPALHQLEQDGLVESEWEGAPEPKSAAGPGKRRRRYYTITPQGRKRLAHSQAEWQCFLTRLFKTLQGGEPGTQERQL